MEEIYHPLIDDAVTNSLEIKRNIILTGSNASGKSTFVKAVAINAILGQSIFTCTGKRVVLPDTGVRTSMAVRDDVLSGESYFMREIKYLKRMIKESIGERPMIFCIDEILRGTNTAERIAASISILDYLADKNCRILVASHDLELAETMAQVYDNYHFRETLEDGDVIFDYKLREGVSNSRNAIQLLKVMGFPNEIVDGARKLCLNNSQFTKY
jgi:DNA mismatch repair ATPase MutS